MAEVIEFGYYDIDSIVRENNTLGVYIKVEPDVVMPRRTYDDPPTRAMTTRRAKLMMLLVSSTLLLKFMHPHTSN